MTRAGEVLAAAGVEVHRGAREVGVAVVEPAGLAGRLGVGVDRLQRGRDGGLLRDRRGGGPRLVGHARALPRAVVVLDGATDAALGISSIRPRRSSVRTWYAVVPSVEPSQPESSTGLAGRSSSSARMRTRSGWLIAFTYRGSSMFVIGSNSEAA